MKKSKDKEKENPESGIFARLMGPNPMVKGRQESLHLLTGVIKSVHDQSYTQGYLQGYQIGMDDAKLEEV